MTLAFLFDLDGTLIDSSPGIFAATKHALTQMGYPIPSAEALKDYIGPTLKHGFTQLAGMTEAEADQAIGYFRAYYQEKGLTDVIAYEGIAETLASLSQSYELYVATSKHEPFAIQTIENLGFTSYFKGLVGAVEDGLRETKAGVIQYLLDQYPHLKNQTVWMIGDRHHDMAGAVANQLTGVGVLYGFGSQHELETAGASYLVARPIELIALVNQHVKAQD